MNITLEKPMRSKRWEAPCPPIKAAVLSARGLRLRNGDDVVVDDLSFEVRSGEVYGLVDPGGAGKTAVVRMVCGLLKPDDGAVTVEGSLGYVAQTVVTIPSGTVADNLAFWARVGGIVPARRGGRIKEVLSDTGLECYSSTSVDQCPGGVLRLLSLAVAMLHRPRLLVLDEPAQGIDLQSRQRLQAILGRLRDQGMAVLYGSRNVDEVRGVADRIGLLYGGQL